MDKSNIPGKTIKHELIQYIFIFVLTLPGFRQVRTVLAFVRGHNRSAPGL